MAFWILPFPETVADDVLDDELTEDFVMKIVYDVGAADCVISFCVYHLFESLVVLFSDEDR